MRESGFLIVRVIGLLAYLKEYRVEFNLTSEIQSLKYNKSERPHRYSISMQFKEREGSRKNLLGSTCPIGFNINCHCSPFSTFFELALFGSTYILSNNTICPISIAMFYFWSYQRTLFN